MRVVPAQKNDLEKIAEEIKARDYQDSHRELNPLKQAEDAVFLDTTEMTIEENIDAVAEIINSVR
jgi:cytidylate kinase